MSHHHRHRKLLAVAAGLGFGLGTVITAGAAGATLPPDEDDLDPRPCDEVFADMADMVDDIADETEPADDMTDDMADETEPADDMTDDMDEAPFVQVAATEWGDILVDADCAALYVFLPDASGEVSCVDDCAVAWPPLFVGDDADAADVTLADELDADLFDIAEHPDGPMLSVAGWPLYYFAQDEEPGDLNGQGINDIWFVVSPDGEPIEQLPDGDIDEEMDEEMDEGDETDDEHDSDEEEMDDY